jgi:hypothetical protein
MTNKNKLFELIEQTTFDGIFFTINSNGNENNQWDLSFLNFTENQEITKTEIGTKHNIVLLDHDSGIPIAFDAFLLDEKQYIKNLISNKQEALVVKKNAVSDIIVEKIKGQYKNG